jgi:hypothetical protein
MPIASVKVDPDAARKLADQARWAVTYGAQVRAAVAPLLEAEGARKESFSLHNQYRDSNPLNDDSDGLVECDYEHNEDAFNDSESETAQFAAFWA